MRLELQNISKSFGEHVALQDISIKIKEGKLTSFLGPSGCGKTTLLRIISGLEYPSSGKLFLNGDDITYQKSKIRNVGFVFQHYALFQHMTVFDNVAFGLTVKPKKERLSKEALFERVHEVLSLVQLDNQSKKYPSQLSGGQQQRIALARVLAIRPKILLLDEPFGALDATVRRELRRWLRNLHEEIHITTILVTHDQEEALEISDEVALFNQGILEQVGSPRDIYTSPVNSFVYEFLGVVNVFHGRFKQHNLVHFTPSAQEEFIDSEVQQIYVRPHEIQVYPLTAVHAKNASLEKELQGTIIRVSFIANTVHLDIKVDMHEETEHNDADTDKEKVHTKIIEASISENEWEQYKYKAGDKVYLQFQKLSSFV